MYIFIILAILLIIGGFVVLRFGRGRGNPEFRKGAPGLILAGIILLVTFVLVALTLRV